MGVSSTKSLEPTPHQYQKAKLIGPAKKRQTNSHLPNGKAPGSVKKCIRVKNSHNEEVGMPRHPQPSRPLGLEKNLMARVGPGDPVTPFSFQLRQRHDWVKKNGLYDCGSATPKSRQIFRANRSWISVCRVTEDRRLFSGLPHHEWLAPYRMSRQP